MNFSVQHLSDEAVAAFADGYLGAVARTRAARHLAACTDCAHSVAVQREAACALRAAPVPALPTGLLDRLRAVPATTPLPPDQGTLAPDGSTVFPAFGTVLVAGFVAPSAMKSAARTPSSRALLPISRLVRRRTQHLAFATAAIALVAIGVAASSPSAATTHPGTAQSNTHGGTDVVRVVYPVLSPPTGAGDGSILLPGNVRPSHR